MLVGNFGTNRGLLFRNLLKINMRNTLFCLHFSILFTSSERIKLNCKLQLTFKQKYWHFNNQKILTFKPDNEHHRRLFHTRVRLVFGILILSPNI